MMPDDKLLALPGSSWETIKRIIRAFYAVQNEETPRLVEIARYAAVPRPVVSTNNNFLRSVNIVRPDQWKLTDMGTRYVTALQMDNDSMAREELANIVRSNPLLDQLLKMLLARGEMKADTFKAEALLRLVIAPNDRQAMFFKPIFDMLLEAGLISMDGDNVSLANAPRPSNQGEKTPPRPIELGKLFPAPAIPSEELPLLLAPNRIVYVRLPDDWDSKKDLGKLLKLLEISLGDNE
jgi:hypothetical protein